MTARDDLLRRMDADSPPPGPSQFPRRPTNVELVDAAIAEALHDAAEKQRDGDGARIEYGDPICNCPDLIDPAKQETP